MRLFYFFILFVFVISAQNEHRGTLKVKKDYSILSINSSFSEDSIFQYDYLLDELLEEGVVIKIKYYYTTYAKSPSFDQDALNKKRKEELIKRYPELNHPLITWEDVPQSNCNDPETCKELFHGFKIQFRPKSTVNHPEDEVAYLDSLFHYLNYKDSLDKGLQRQIEDPEYKVMKSIWDDKVGWVPDTASRGKVVVPKPRELEIEQVVLRTMERNDWDNVVYVVDVTASMSPYSAQVMYWMKSEVLSGNVQNFTFFNDGNGKPNNRKKIGETGGVYHYKGDDFNKMFDKLRTCMNVNSGDMQENDGEALLESIKEFPNSTGLVLIADNYSPVRDFVLFDKVQMPVHIITCGLKSSGVNPQYIQLAMLTGGTIETMNESLKVPKIQEGEVIEILGQRYKMIDGGIVQL